MAHRIILSESVKDRFFAKVRIDKKTGCHIFTDYCDRDGYGKFNVGGIHYTETASRVAWVIANGQIPDGLCVLHRCDNPPCVNPEHLYLGTNQDNTDDMKRRGRSTAGERNSHAKLKEYQVLDILRLFHNGLSMGTIARRYSVSLPTISHIVYGRGWKHIYREFIIGKEMSHGGRK